MNQIITSALGKLDVRDFLHGLYIAVLGSVTDILSQWVSSLVVTHQFVPLDWKQVLNVAGITAVAYLFKKLTTPAQVITPLSK